MKKVNNVKKNRNVFIDVMKGLLIILVVIGHLPYFEYDSRTLTLIYSFHMPAFLIIGGILSHINENTDIKEIIIKRFKGILVPYFVFYFISLVIVPSASWDLRTQAIITAFRGVGDPNTAVNLPLWFLPFYFCAITIFEIIECYFYKFRFLLFEKKTNTKNRKYFFVGIFTSIVIMIIMYISFYYSRVYKGPRLPFNLEISAFCVGFVFIGKFFSNFVIYAKKNINISIVHVLLSLALIIVFIISWYFLSLKNGRIDLNARDYKNAFYMYLNATTGFIIFALYSYIISYLSIIKNILSYIGQNSIYILAYHIPVSLAIHNIIIPLLPIEFANSLSYNSISSIIFFTTFQILFSLFFGAIQKTCQNIT